MGNPQANINFLYSKFTLSRNPHLEAELAKCKHNPQIVGGILKTISGIYGICLHLRNPLTIWGIRVRLRNLEQLALFARCRICDNIYIHMRQNLHNTYLSSESIDILLVESTYSSIFVSEFLETLRFAPIQRTVWRRNDHLQSVCMTKKTIKF